MCDVLVKIYINKMDPKRRKVQKDAPAIRGPLSLLVLLSLSGGSLSGTGKAKVMLLGSFLRSGSTLCLSLPQLCTTQRGHPAEGVSGTTDSHVSVRTLDCKELDALAEVKQINNF